MSLLRSTKTTLMTFVCLDDGEGFSFALLAVGDDPPPPAPEAVASPICAVLATEIRTAGRALIR